MIRIPWKDIIKETIWNCFCHAGLHVDDISDGSGLAQAFEPDFCELWQEFACFPGTVPRGAQFGEFVGVDDTLEVALKLTITKIVSEFGCNSVENISDDDQPEQGFSNILG